jgi:D-beta-D-heptose 7-phosphate kinase/D-beta-D-heptose 1-phosphate adenosyltransferase
MKELYKDIKILVIGDSCTDVFTYGSNFRLAPEGPVPVFVPIRNSSNGGMALNVKANIEAIGSYSFLITQEEKITKTRFVDDRTNYLMLRVDTNDKASKISKNIIRKIRNNFFENIFYDAIVISDYCKGFLSEEDIKEISIHNKNIFLDTKKILSDWCKNVSYIKINHVEYERTLHTIEKLDIIDKLIITRSQEGCEFQGKIYPVDKVEIKDVSGAGDTFISGLVCEFIRTKDIERAIKFAQYCASIVVQKKGVCTI